MLKTTSQLIIKEAESRGWETEILDEKKSFIRFWDEQGKEYLLRSTTSAKTSAINYLVALNKEIVYKLASEQGLIIPETVVFEDLAQANNFLSRHGQIVVKPVEGGHGNGVTTNIKKREQIKEAIDFAKHYNSRVLMQNFVAGDDYRLLFIGYELCAAAIREPASVIGDGEHTIEELIQIENKNPERGINYSKKLNVIAEAEAKRYLSATIKDIPLAGKKIIVMGTANMGKGGRAIDVTETLDQRMVQNGLNLIQSLDMPLCGVDFVYDKNKLGNNEPVLIEINGTPSFGLHEFPSEGQARPVTKEFIDWLTDSKNLRTDKNMVESA